MNLPRILFVNHSSVLGGGELSLFDLINSYNQRTTKEDTVKNQASQVLLFSEGPFQEKLKTAGINVKTLSVSSATLNVKAFSKLDALKAIPGLWTISNQIANISQDFQLIHANSQKAFIAAALAKLQGAPPLVWHLRDILTASHFSPLNRHIAIFLANRFATKVIVNSKATGEAFIAAGGKPELIEVVYNGFQAEPFSKVTSAEITAIRQELAIGESPIVGIFSRLSYWKGQHILLEAVRQLPGVHVLLVGDALFGENEYKEKLQALSQTPELKNRVHWLGFRHDIPVLMKTCDIIVHASTEPEPFGRVIIEGQLAKKPVIAAAAGGAIELIENKITGFLVSPGDITGLVNVLKTVLNNPTESNQIAEQGYLHAKSYFTLSATVNNFIQVINNIL